MKTDLTRQFLLNKIKYREMLKNCCKQKWASKDEIQHWEKGIVEYDKEIFQLCELTGDNEYMLIKEVINNK